MTIDKKENCKKVASSSSCSSSSCSSSSYITIDLTRLHVGQIGLFHRLIEIADEVDDMTRVKITKSEFDRLIGNFNETVEEEEEEEKESVSTGGEGRVLEENVSAEVSAEISEEEESVSGISGVVEDSSPPSPPLEYPAEAISRLFNQINEMNLGIYALSALTIGMEEEEEEE